MKIRPKFLILGITALTLAATAAACIGDAKDDPTPVATATPTISPTAAPAVSSQPTATTPGILQYIVIQEGDGPTPQVGDVVELQYSVSLENGVKLEGSADSGKALRFVLGTGEILPGIDQGVAKMREHGEAKLIIPPELAFGSEGSEALNIPPDASLIFEAELVSVVVIPLPAAVPQTKVDESQYTTTDSGLKYYDIKVGDGATPQHGQRVLVHYTGWLTDGTQFDSSIPRGAALPFWVGVGEMIPGFDEGVSTMKIGGKRQMVLPPELAYKDQERGKIPANSTLIFEVELMYAY